MNMPGPFGFGCAVASCFVKQAFTPTREQYERSGHANTMSYEDWASEYDDAPSAAAPAAASAPAPASAAPAPTAAAPAPAPAGGAAPQQRKLTPADMAPEGMQYNRWTGVYNSTAPTDSMATSLKEWRPYQPSWAGRLNPTNYKFSPQNQNMTPFQAVAAPFNPNNYRFQSPNSRPT